MRISKVACLVIMLLTTAAQAFSNPTCSQKEHEIQARGPWPPALISGLAAVTGSVAALASGDQSDIAVLYLVTVPSLSGLLGLMSMPCPAARLRTDAARAGGQPYSQRDRNLGTLVLVGFNTAVAGSTSLLSHSKTSRVIAAVATGLSAISPLLFLDRFLDNDSLQASVELGNAVQLTVAF